MRRPLSSKLLCALYCLLIFSCSPTPPEKYFDIAVLNSNMLSGFADDGLLRELESPSIKMNEKGEAAPIKRDEVLNTKIHFLEENLEKLQGLKETADTRDMLTTSVSLYHYVLPVYKTEYKNLARLYDEGAPKEQIQAQALLIHDKFYGGFTTLYNKLIGTGKLYAAEHSIKVNWAAY